MCRGWAPILLHQKQRANEDVTTTNTNILQHQDVCFQSLHCLLYIWLTVMKILCSITSDVVLKSFYQTLIKAPYWLRLLITLAPPKMPLFVFCITPELPSCYSTVHLLSSVCLSSCFSLLSLTRTHTYISFFFFFIWLQVPIVNFLSACFCAHYPLTGFEWIESPLGADLFEFQMMIRDWFTHTRQSNFFSL